MFTNISAGDKRYYLIFSVTLFIIYMYIISPNKVFDDIMVLALPPHQSPVACSDALSL